MIGRFLEWFIGRSLMLAYDHPLTTLGLIVAASVAAGLFLGRWLGR